MWGSAPSGRMIDDGYGPEPRAPRCPDRRSRAVRHRRRPLPAGPVPVGFVGHLRGPRRDRRHVGPVPVSGGPLRLRHVHARLRVPPVGRGQGDRGRRLDPGLHQGPRGEAGIDGRVRFHHRVLRAAWSSDEARWHITAQRTDTGEAAEVTCRFLFCCTGYYRYDHGYLPDFAGMDRFAGTIVHPQAWPEDLSHNGRRVIVIGSGATAVTLVPALAETAAHVTMVQRSPSYVASLPARDPIADALRRALPRRYSGPVIKWVKALTTQGVFRLSRSPPEPVKPMLRRMPERH